MLLALADVTRLGSVLQTERSPVQLLVRALACVVGSASILGICKRQPIDISLLLFLPPSPSLWNL